MLPPKNNEGNRRVLEMFSKLRRKSSLSKYSVNKKMHIAEATMCI
ncbi:hypothetical protein VCR4J2_510052 [Vibrio coralliirubri]|nr:hypothetical protein VCR4J2_510052 [Vibrio coralliirubri]